MQWEQHSGTRDMKTTLSKWLLVRMVSRPGDVFRELAETEPEVHVVFCRYLIRLALLPPLFAYIGAGARESPGVHLAFVCIIAAPLVAGSVFHLFPHVFINILVLIPADP